MVIVDNEILQGFYQEARGYIPDIRSGMKALKSAPRDREAAAEVHRLVHSIKGAASMVGLSTLSHIAYLAEEAIEEATEGKLPTTPQTWAAIERAIESIGAFVESAASGKLRERPVVEDVVVRLRRLRGLPEEGNEAAIEELLQDTDDPAEPGLTGEPPSENGFEQDAVSPELWEAFRAEADEYTQSISAALRRIKKEPADGETLLELRRVVHTLKGAAAVVGLRSAAEIAHRMEDLLDLLHDGGDSLADDTLGLLFETADVLEDLTTDRPSGQMETRLEKLHQEYGRRLLGASGELSRSAQVSEPKALFDGPAPGEAPVDPEILEAFAIEAEEHLQAISGLLRDLAKQPKDKDLTLEVRRRVHTLKGAAAMTGMTAASGLAHRMEDLLDQVHEDKIELAEVAQDLLFTSTDALEDLTAKGGANSQSQDQLSEILGVYDEILGAPETPVELPPDDALGRLLEEDHVIDLTQMPKAPPAAKVEAAGAAASARPTRPHPPGSARRTRSSGQRTGSQPFYFRTAFFALRSRSRRA